MRKKPYRKLLERAMIVTISIAVGVGVGVVVDLESSGRRLLVRQLDDRQRFKRRRRRRRGEERMAVPKAYER